MTAVECSPLVREVLDGGLRSRYRAREHNAGSQTGEQPSLALSADHPALKEEVLLPRPPHPRNINDTSI
jgi:hypothetical protein